METEWDTVELVPSVKAPPVVQSVAESAPDYLRVANLERWLISNLGARDVGFSDDDDCGNLIVVLGGLRLDDSESNIIPSLRTFCVRGEVTVCFDVDLSVDASSEEEAYEKGLIVMSDYGHATIGGHNYEAEDWGHGLVSSEIHDVEEQ